MQGFINLNKPFGLTSHDCVARLRKLLRLRKVGHGGTLDPSATGVLPIAVGKATRLLQYLPTDKAYKATIQFGVQTATDDLEGDVLATHPADNLTLEQVQPHLARFQGTIEQIPPSYSAIQVGGKRLYDLARAGEAVEAPMRTVQVYQIEILDWRSGQFPELDVWIACGSGTYIRSIARDLGAAIGTGGTLAALLRTQSSGFELSQSLTLEALTEQIETKTFQPIPPTMALQHLPSIVLSDSLAQRWRQGQRIYWQEVTSLQLKPASPTTWLSLGETDRLYRIQEAGDRFLGIATYGIRHEEERLLPKLVWETGT
jgi:tRNA pseudouridine55 synthase